MDDRQQVNGATMVFRGPSMRPTLTEPALLDLETVAPEALRRGDVVAFWSPELGRHVVHRIVGGDAAGWVTRGDNNPGDDPQLLSAAQVVGRVVAASVGRRQRRVVNGARGLRRHHWLRVRRVLRRIVARASVGRLLRRMARGVARRLPVAWRPTRRQYADGRVQWLLGRRVVARQSSPGAPWRGLWWARSLVDEDEWR